MSEELQQLRRFSRRLRPTSHEPPLPPPLPPGGVHLLPGRGETFARVTRQPAGQIPVLLLHGWTASADTNWWPLYDELDGTRPLAALDHRGHGRGMRPEEPFTLEDCADDAAALVEQLGFEKVIVAGYSMGGPIALHFWRRHPEMTAGLVLGATALEWRATFLERLTWRFLAFFELALRVGTAERFNTRLLREQVEEHPELAPIRAWLAGELRRGAPTDIAAAGRALSLYDARPFAGDVDVPTAVVLTTRDRLVRPKKQRQLAAATRARIFSVHGDHDLPIADPKNFAIAFRDAIEHVAAV